MYLLTPEEIIIKFLAYSKPKFPENTIMRNSWVAMTIDKWHISHNSNSANEPLKQQPALAGYQVVPVFLVKDSAILQCAYWVQDFIAVFILSFRQKKNASHNFTVLQ